MITMDKRFSLEDYKALKQIVGGVQDSRLINLIDSGTVTRVERDSRVLIEAMANLKASEEALYEQAIKLFPESVITEAKMTIPDPEA